MYYLWLGHWVQVGSTEWARFVDWCLNNPKEAEGFGFAYIDVGTSPEDDCLYGD